MNEANVVHKVDYNIHSGIIKGKPREEWKGTYKWARDEGFAHKQAMEIVKGNLSVDQKGMKRERHRNTNVNQFKPSTQSIWAEKEMRKALKNDDLVALGRGLHSIQDEVQHGSVFYWFDRHVRGYKRYDPDRFLDESRVEAETRKYLQRYILETNLAQC